MDNGFNSYKGTIVISVVSDFLSVFRDCFNSYKGTIVIFAKDLNFNFCFVASIPIKEQLLSDPFIFMGFNDKASIPIKEQLL